jgi:hypothetical protein
VQLSQIRGLASYGAPRVWPKDGSAFVGSIHIHLAPQSTSDPGRPSEAVYQHAATYVNVEGVVKKKHVRGLAEIAVQVEPGQGGQQMGGGFCGCLS